MVQLMNSGNIRPESEKPCRNKPPVKLETEDPLDEEHGPLNKRCKPSLSFQQRSTGVGSFPIPPSQYNPLDEPSPLGLSLKKSPSFLDLIQMRLSQGNASTIGAVYNEDLCSSKRKDLKCATGLVIADKLKASNFPASLLRIGTWERVSRYEGDLVAKCYFAKHKLVWEVLEGGLKSKIEIQWSDIMDLKANCPENGPGTLDIVLARQPLFFKETNPQPRKHTLWQATSDFTGGQASIQRRHFLQCPQGLLSKHFEKLIQCDPRLNMLSQQPEIVLDSPYFESRASLFDNPDESKSHGLDPVKVDYESTFSGLGDASSPSAAQSSSMKSELLDSGASSRAPEHLSRETPSPSSVMDTRVIEGTTEPKELSQWDQLKVPGIHPSMSMSDLVSHIEQCISGQMNVGTDSLSGEGTRDLLEDITQYLLGDSQMTSASDEQSLMSRVNSLCCLVQKDPAAVQNLQVKCQGSAVGPDDGKTHHLNSTFMSASENKVIGVLPEPEGSSNDVLSCKPAPAMSRKDSVGDLLLHLPRIASLPQFLFNMSEDFDNQAR